MNDLIDWFKYTSPRYYPFGPNWMPHKSDFGILYTLQFPTFNQRYLMNPTPQAVTERYVTNLINYGRNREFDIEMITMKENVVESTQVGTYFSARVLSKTSAEQAVGATLSQAVRNCLIKHGVTFR